ncbi:Transposase, IS116/IS110/IS902 family, partial [Leptospira interrogans serovar Muenchen]
SSMSFRFSSTKSKTFNILSASFWYRLGSKATEISLFAFVLKCFLVICVKPAWSLVRCQHGGKVKEFYQRLYLKKGAKKSIIATSRKMIEVLYVMIRTGKLFDSMPENILNRKLTQYGLM